MNSKPGPVETDTKTSIRRAAAALTGTSLWAYRRTADLASFHFGEKSETRTFRGETVEVGAYALHVQCSWRISRENDVLVGSGDLHYPANLASHETPPENFEWRTHPNRVDELLQLLFQNGTRQFLVRNVEPGVGASLRLVLDQGLFLEIFPDNSLANEHWRLLKPGRNEPHFVVSGNGVVGYDSSPQKSS